MMWLDRFADRVTRRQLVRAINARNFARGEVRRLEKRLRAEELANQTLRQIADRWQSIAMRRVADEQGDTK